MKFTPVPLGTTLSQTAATTINTNLTALSTALENTLSRDGQTPNQMQSDLDMNNNDILNVNFVQAKDIIIDGSELTSTIKQAVEDAEDFALASQTASIVATQARDGAIAAAQRAEQAIVPANPLMFGAIGDGVADDTLALTAMFQSSGQEFDGLGKTYKISSTLTVARGNLRLKNLTLTGVIGVQTPSLRFAGSVGPAVTLGVNVPQNTSSVTVPSGLAFRLEQWVWLKSTRVLWPTSNTFGELCRIKNIVGNVLTFYDATRLYYNTADAATITPIEMLDDITLENIWIKGDTSVTRQIGIQLEFCTNSVLVDPYTTDCEYVHIHFLTCADCSVRGGWGERTGVLAGLNYGIVAGNSCKGISVTGYTGRSMRHAFSNGGSVGINQDLRVWHSTAIDSIDAGFDAHPSAVGIDFSHNIVRMRVGLTAGDGIICQGLDFTAVGNKVYGAPRHSIFYQPLLTYTGVRNKCNIIGNEVETYQPSASSSGGIVVSSSIASPFDMLLINSNLVKGHKSGILIQTTLPDIAYLSVQGNVGVGLTIRGIHITRTTAGSVLKGTVSGNTLEVLSGGFEVIYLQSDAASGISNLVLNGNNTTGGTTSIRGVNTDYCLSVGNICRGWSGLAVNVAGAASVKANNIEVA